MLKVERMNLTIKLPKHINLTIEHNPHATNYQTVSQYLNLPNVDDDSFETNETKQKCIKTGEIWELRWYPDTPVGSCRIIFDSLERLLKWCEVNG